jgi:hypothetical protein
MRKRKEKAFRHVGISGNVCAGVLDALASSSQTNPPVQLVVHTLAQAEDM